MDQPSSNSVCSTVSILPHLQQMEQQTPGDTLQHFRPSQLQRLQSNVLIMMPHMADNNRMQEVTPKKRRRRAPGSGFGGGLRMCPHCGRTFKRTEHLERHVRTRKIDGYYVVSYENNLHGIRHQGEAIHLSLRLGICETRLAHPASATCLSRGRVRRRLSDDVS